MDDSEGKDIYVSQLKQVFDSCDATGSGCLNEAELQVLCDKLHLSDHASFLTKHLLEHEPEVKFDDFKESFVAILTQGIPNEEVKREGDDDIADREVSPKFTLGRKKYGRRSRPASIADDDGSITSPLLSPQNSADSLYSDKMSSHGGDCISAKRPVSPNSNQQPPVKSSRILSDKTSTNTEEVLSPMSSDSDSDAVHTFDSNPVQYLHDTWKKLGIGQNGYLNVEELALVCEHIGMDMTEEVVAQLFEKLDCDQDGQISFDEFLQGLFQHEEPQSCDANLLKSDLSKSVYNDGPRDDQISNTNISGIFSSIDPEGTGYADASAILELWESFELPCSPQLLEELGFNSNLKINLSDLSSVLEEVLVNSLKRPILHLAFSCYQNEIHFLRQSLEQMRSERNRLRVTVEEANSRAALLAQEVDDSHAKLENSLQKKLLLMEKKYQDQTRELFEELQQERDSISLQTNSLRLKLQKDIDVLREEEAKLRSKLNLLEKDNLRLEHELHDATERCLEVQKQNETLQKELSVVPDLKQRLAEMESQLSEFQEQRHQSLLQELESYKKTNQELQDKIDELTLEMESLHQTCVTETSSSPKGVNRTHSWLSDYKKSTVTGKRRGSESSSDNSDDESPNTGKIRKTILADEKMFEDLEKPDIQSYIKRNLSLKGNQPSSVDILLRDMLADQSQMMRKLQIAEEKLWKKEKECKLIEMRCKIYSRGLGILTED